MITLEAGLIITWGIKIIDLFFTYFLPALSAFKMHLKQSPKTLTFILISF